MAEAWIVCGLIFMSVTMCALLAQFGLRDFLQHKRRTAKRYQSLDRSSRPTTEPKLLRKRANTRGFGGVVAAMNLLLLQSGTEISLRSLALRAAFLWIAFAAMPLALPFAVKGPVAAIAVGLVVYGYLSFQKARRIARFAEQLPDIVDIIVRSLRAGHPLPVSLALVGRETPIPAGSEFAAVVNEIAYGRSIVEALETMESRVGYRELRFFVASITIAQQTGGNLAEILARLSKMLRERFRLKRKIRALSAEGRFSGYALSLLPILLFALINIVSASYYQEFWESAQKGPVLLFAGGLLLLGNVVIYKLVNFRV